MLCFVFFFFKQKTAYDMRISDWSSDVCSSDLKGVFDMWAQDNLFVDSGECEYRTELFTCDPDQNVSIIDGTLQVPREQFFAGLKHHGVDTVPVKIGRASCRERVCQ